MIDDKILLKATQCRTKIEFGLKTIFNLKEDTRNIGNHIKRLKKYNIKEENILVVQKIWNITSEILHNNLTNKLIDKEIKFVLNLLRDTMMKKCNNKKEYIIDDIACYKLLFNKRLMKELKQNNIIYYGYPRTKSEKENIWGFEDIDLSNSIFGQFLYNDIYIPKCLFNSLTTTPKQIMCLIEERTEDGYSQKVGLALKNDFDINKLYICSQKMYYNYNDTIDKHYNNNLEILVDIEVNK